MFGKYLDFVRTQFMVIDDKNYQVCINIERIMYIGVLDSISSRLSGNRSSLFLLLRYILKLFTNIKNFMKYEKRKKKIALILRSNTD